MKKRKEEIKKPVLAPPAKLDNLVRPASPEPGADFATYAASGTYCTAVLLAADPKAIAIDVSDFSGIEKYSEHCRGKRADRAVPADG